MPAAAVIPAPMVYANIVAVKKLVVEFLRKLIFMWSQRSAKKDDLSYFMLSHRWNSFSDRDVSLCLL